MVLHSLAACVSSQPGLSSTSIGFHDPDFVIPSTAAEIGARTNTLSAVVELVFIVVIMNADLSVRQMMDTEIRKAIANDNFLLLYQPQINEIGKVVGAEALIRW
ncbi:MAG: hypothetical protein WBW32_02755 [Luteibacter sp.]